MTKLILIAESDIPARSAMLLLANLWGHAVIVARTGLEAVDLVMRRRPDIVLMNVQLPIMSGIEASEFIHLAKPRHTPTIIALAAQGGARQRRASADAGFVAHLVQPICPAELKMLLDYS